MYHQHTHNSFSQIIKIRTIELFPLATADGQSPEMALGTMPSRPALLLKLTDTDDCYGWGEIWANFPPRAHIHKAELVEDVVAAKLKDIPFTHPVEVQNTLRAQLEVYFLHIGQSQVLEHILAGIDIALWDLALRKSNRNFAQHINADINQAPTYASSINGADLHRLIPAHAELGQQHFKLKVGFQPDGGLALLADARSLIPDGGHVMLDANQAWSLDQAINALKTLEEFEPLFAEEPLRADATKSAWETLAGASSIPLAAGENIYGIDQFIAMGNAGVAYLQPDVCKWGGVSGALELASQLPAGTSLWPHFMGTAVGQLAALAITAAMGENTVCEMDANENPLRTELCGDVLGVADGFVSLREDAGLVHPPLADCLTGFYWGR